MLFVRTILIVLLLTTQAFAGQIRVSDTDYRAYRTLTLDTGLEVLLVQDEKASKAAAALALPVGSLHDPASQPGLAHYLEHMLFLGSAAYPAPEEYQSFITAHGGQTNAGTGYTSTVYMMEVDTPAFPEALGRMADTLAHPLLDPVYTDKERHAVNAEMESRKYNDGQRLAMLALSTLSPAHPATHFTGGNLQTLSDKPGSRLHDELLRFHRTWYRANLMKAVLYGPQSLDALESLARRELSVIPSGGSLVPVPGVAPITAAERGVIFGVRPVARINSLSLDFVFPKDLDENASKPLQVVAQVLGTETPHSLIATLRDQGLIFGLSVGVDSTTLGNGVILSLHAQLTAAGARQRDTILGEIFSYFALLRQKGVRSEYFTQLRDMLAMEFRFAPLTSGFDYVARAAEQMLREPVADVNYAPYRLDFFDQKAVRTVLAGLTPDNARIFQVGQDQPVDQQAFFYQTPYSVRLVKAEDVARWETLAAGKHLTLPDLNPFIPDTFALARPESKAWPQEVLKQPGLHIWWAQSKFRREPKAILLVRLHSAHSAASLEQAAAQGLFLELWAQKQAGLHYQAQEAGLDVGISGDEGFVIRIDGFSQHQAELLARTLEFLDTPVTAGEFERAKAEVLRTLGNVGKQAAFGRLMGETRTLLRVPSFTPIALEEAAQKIGLDDVRAYARQVRQDLSFTVFGFGNVTAEGMKKLRPLLAPYIGVQAQQSTIKAARVLPVAGVRVDYPQRSELEDSALVELFLDPTPGPRSTARILLLEELLSSRFYSRLRTEEQLGYVATSFPVMFAHCAGIGFGVQSPVLGVAGLADRFESFYFQALRQLRVGSAAEFASVRQGVLASLTQTPDTLAEEMGWLETDLRLGNARFNSRTQLVQAVKAVRLAEVTRTYERLVVGPGSTRLRLQMQGTRGAEQGFATLPGMQRIARPAQFHALMGVQRYQGL